MKFFDDLNLLDFLNGFKNIKMEVDFLGKKKLSLKRWTNEIDLKNDCQQGMFVYLWSWKICSFLKLINDFLDNIYYLTFHCQKYIMKLRIQLFLESWKFYFIMKYDFKPWKAIIISNKL